MPDLVDELTPDEAAPAPDTDAGPQGGPLAGFAGSGAPKADSTTERVKSRPAFDKPQWERDTRTAAAALLVGVLAFVASNFTELAVAVALLWLVALLCLCVAVVDGFRGRRRVQTHPEQWRGLWVATITFILAIAGIIGMTASVFGVVGDEAAADAPLGVGDLQSVQVARWGLERTQRLKDNGWTQPAREEGTCWKASGQDERDVDRVEIAERPDEVDCDEVHTLEVARVFAVNRDADAPYPSPEAFVAAAGDQCNGIVESLAKKGIDVALQIEYPTEVGWNAADHDVACVFVTGERKEPLVS